MTLRGSGITAPADGPAPIGAWFDRMIPNCLDYAQAARLEERPVVGIMCEFTPRELIMAGGGVPVCLCGGAASMIPAAEEELPANLCPLIKSTYGYDLSRANPFLEMADLVVAETTCDGKKKMFERIAARRAMHILELPQKPDDPDALTHWRRELEKLRALLEERWKLIITDSRMRAAIALMNRERRLRRALADLMREDHPPLTGRRLLGFNSLIAGIPAMLAALESAVDAFAAAPRPAGRRPRVLLTGVPVPHGAERVVELIEECGGLIVAFENCSGLKPVLEDVDGELAATDPIGALARKYLHLPCSVMTPNDRRLDTIERLAADFRADCIIDLVWHACLTYDMESARVQHLAARLAIPFLKIQTDYSPADSARLAVRIQALLERVG